MLRFGIVEHRQIEEVIDFWRTCKDGAEKSTQNRRWENK